MCIEHSLCAIYSDSCTRGYGIKIITNFCQLELHNTVGRWTYIHTNSNSSQIMIIPKSKVWTNDWGNTRMGEINFFYRVGGEGSVRQVDIKKEFMEAEPWRRVLGERKKTLKKDHKNWICRVRKTSGQWRSEELLAVFRNMTLFAHYRLNWIVIRV